MHRLALLVGAVLVWASVAHAHAPGTAVARAVAALRVSDVSYDPASALSEVDVGAIERRVETSHDVAVAVMPAQALEEVTGGPDRVAAEIAAEAARSGTVIVVAGTRVGGWSARLTQQRLAALVRTATATGSPPAQVVLDLVNSVEGEQQTQASSGSGSIVWVAVGAAGALAALVAAAAALRRRQPRAPTRP